MNQPKNYTSDYGKTKIIRTASICFIKGDVKAVAPDGSLYLSSTDVLSIALSYLSDNLRLFLQTIAGGKMEEQTSLIGQALIQSIRAKDFPTSLYIDLEIQIHHHFGSRFLIDSQHEHQFYSSYKEAQKYQCSSAVESADIPLNRFNQYVADNVDHNLVTLDCLHIPWNG